ncbi:PREDICTED: uncharacterized protein LOC108773075 [Cyphomyrmex costatus]|uniref:uncharacterized protein LOC108773075 n=1 Tax=Cyphomyrmex costatus TaxID=456900 RepID=UPI0008522FD8|nr:PREDICTED: uncharacterized protein LOC108773075 [Cyphomyrmex costatus]
MDIHQHYLKIQRIFLVAYSDMLYNKTMDIPTIKKKSNKKSMKHINQEESESKFISNECYISDYVTKEATKLSSTVAQSVATQINCKICKHLLFDTNKSITKNNSIEESVRKQGKEKKGECEKKVGKNEEKRKCNCNMSVASNDVVKICYIAETIIRGHLKILKVQYPIKKLIKVAFTYVTSDIFDNVLHMLTQKPLQDHRTNLINLILDIYFRLRVQKICDSGIRT